ncbi:MAG: tRNA (adenosine(37)-N6)-threonylcarbamoyltransferase complex ATPase subunit type 1 TsaE [Actinobacteria bacterium]|nr:tRNA (adenosine(37)-N6)-threonylcarbamoyltransferase complex ATPase subunit type 1 TsaE [Actinomycetota bacterium]NDE53434.1 tRNA (adenosine(37)-N6)-threonylcarbamoyltransferase complex ATPase subunit type 1 TsaE [Actinomycetota bacterium]
MRDLGARLATRLQARDIVVLQGNLGAGKTAMTQGIGKHLGITDITSPTFVISRTHKGKIPLIHVDAYRLLGSTKQDFEIDDLDLDTAREGAITVIEWGENVASRLQEDYLLVTIEFGEGEDDRIVEFTGHGKRWEGFNL